MATATLGTLQEFQPDAEPIAAYLERVNLYFEANDIKEDQQVVVLLAGLVKLLTDHFEPKPLMIAERFYFH